MRILVWLLAASCGSDVSVRDAEQILAELRPILRDEFGRDVIVPSAVYANGETWLCIMTVGDPLPWGVDGRTELRRHQEGGWTARVRLAGTMGLEPWVVVLHEIGHALGLRHDPRSGRIMSEVASASSPWEAARDLAAACRVEGCAPSLYVSVHGPWLR